MSVGKAVFVSANAARVVVSLDDGFTVVELIGDEGEIGVGDTVFGDWHALGGKPIRKGAEDDAFDGYFQGMLRSCDDA